MHALILILAGFFGGMINAIAGGGVILMYPALLAYGLAPVIANATSSFVVWPGGLAAVYGYRRELKKIPKSFLWLALPAVTGAIIGSLTLVHSKASTFEKLAPWLILVAVIMLAFQARIHKWLTDSAERANIHWHALPVICGATFFLAIYGGYFGVGFGLMMLVLLGFTQLKNIHQMNVVKNLSGFVMAIVATIYFAHVGIIDWRAGLTMIIGTVLGGWFGARVAQKVSGALVHKFMVVIGLVIVVYLFARN